MHIALPGTQVKREKRPTPLEQVLQGVQLAGEPHQAGLPQTAVLLGLLPGDRDAIAAFIDLVRVLVVINSKAHHITSLTDFQLPHEREVPPFLTGLLCTTTSTDSKHSPGPHRAKERL